MRFAISTARHDLGTTVRTLADDLQVPFVLVTHDLGEALRLGDRMVVVDRGTTARTGTPAELIASPETEATRRARPKPLRSPLPPAKSTRPSRPL